MELRIILLITPAARKPINYKVQNNSGGCAHFILIKNHHKKRHISNNLTGPGQANWTNGTKGG